MRNELLSWAEESKKRCSDLTDPLVNGYNYAITHLIDKINSIPLPSIEGYLEGKVHDGSMSAINQEFVFMDDALTALRELKEDCEGEKQEKQREYDWACEEITKWRKNGEEGWQLAEKLTAEVERLKGDGWISVEDAHPQLSKPRMEDGVLFTPVVEYCLVSDGENVDMGSFNERGISDPKATHWK